MKILHSELAQKGDTFTKGDRVAVDAKRGKGSPAAKSWWIGTVLRIEGTKLIIKHDDDGESAPYPYSRSQTGDFIKLPRTTSKIARDLTVKEVRLLLPVVKDTPKSKPVVKTVPPKTVKPTVTPKATDRNLYKWIDEDRKYNSQMKYVLTEAEYRASPWLGVKKSTGRASSTTAYSISVGITSFKNHNCVVSVATGNQDLLYSNRPVNRYGTGEDISKQYAAEVRGTQMDYRSFCNLRMRASEKLQHQAETTRENERKADENFDKHYDKLAVGKQVLIKFSDGPSWKTIQGVDLRKQAVGISGSGSKLRWISFTYVEDVRDKSPY